MRVSAVFTVGVAALFACTTSSDYYDGPQSPCSTGAPYPFETDFEAIPSEMAGGPGCIPRCGLTDDGMNKTLAHLPSGSCRYNGEVCTTAVWRERTCPSGGSVRCSFTGYSCRCEGGEWRCYTGPRGASPCPCLDDAGVRDAATDG